jgi:hypothetical protein
MSSSNWTQSALTVSSAIYDTGAHITVNLLARNTSTAYSSLHPCQARAWQLHLPHTDSTHLPPPCTNTSAGLHTLTIQPSAALLDGWHTNPREIWVGGVKPLDTGAAPDTRWHLVPIISWQCANAAAQSLPASPATAQHHTACGLCDCKESRVQKPELLLLLLPRAASLARI